MSADLCDLILQTLGRQKDDPVCQGLFRALGKAASANWTQDWYFWHYSALGVDLTFFQEKLAGALLHISSAGVRAGRIKPFVGPLPLGIVESNLRADVQKKFEKEPCQTMELASKHKSTDAMIIDVYEHAGARINVTFASIDERLWSISLQDKETADHFTPPSDSV